MWCFSRPGGGSVSFALIVSIMRSTVVSSIGKYIVLSGRNDSQVFGAGRLDCMSAAAKRYKYLRRLIKFDQMDFEFAFWQMWYLFTAPQKVYRNFHYRKQTKSQFARDDPAFLVLLSFWLCVSSIVFAFVLRLGFLGFVKFLLFVSNKYLIKPACQDQDVEWGYAFDVHLNAFFPLLIILHVVQLFFYNGLSILHKTQLLLYPLTVLAIVYIVSLVIGWNITHTLMDFYKYRVL
uniref:UNC-50 family protein n=2 Tax=Timema TaxID=61471 RepID=A0A7R9EMV9_9NEOP|nr:unnamed protein product [Timema bartmani]